MLTKNLGFYSLLLLSLYCVPLIVLAAQSQSEIIQEHIDQGIKYGQSGQIDHAIKEFEHILLIDPNNVDAFNNLGVAYFHLRDFKKSLYYQSKAVDTEPKNPQIYFNRGLLLGKYMFKDREAISDYTKAISLEPKYVRAYLNRGLAYYFLHEYEKAISDFNTIVEINPGSLRNVLKFRAKAYFELGNKEKSLEDIANAEKLGIEISSDLLSKVKAK